MRADLLCLLQCGKGTKVFVCRHAAAQMLPVVAAIRACSCKAFVRHHSSLAVHQVKRCQAAGHAKLTYAEWTTCAALLLCGKHVCLHRALMQPRHTHGMHLSPARHTCAPLLHGRARVCCATNLPLKPPGDWDGGQQICSLHCCCNLERRLSAILARGR